MIILARWQLPAPTRVTGLGADLLVDAMTRTLAAARSIGARALVIHAIDMTAANFDRHHDFQSLRYQHTAVGSGLS